MSDDIRSKILARRAKFLAAVAVGISGCQSKAPSVPEVCLSVPYQPDVEAGVHVPAPDVPNLRDAGDDSEDARRRLIGAQGSDGGHVHPEYCLSVVYPREQ